MKHIKWIHSFLVCVVFAVALSACGGGGSGSGAGGGTTLYTGSETLEVVVGGQTSPVGTFPLTIVIDSAGNVTVTDVDGTQYKGQLDGNNLVATGTLPSASASRITCAATPITYRGTVAGNDITGSSTGTGPCTGPGGTVNATLRGPFKVTRNVQSKDILRGDDKGQAIINSLNLIEQLL